MASLHTSAHPSSLASRPALAGTYGAPAGLAAALAAPARPTLAPAVGSPGGPHAPGTLDALLDSLRSERKLVDDLAATMRRQREAVAVDDLGAVDDTVFATHRLVATLGQARLRRRQLNRLIAGRDEIGLRELDDVVGPQMTDALRGARDGLHASATALAFEVDVNRRVLREALATGEAHARVLATGDPELPRLAVYGYGTPARGTASVGTPAGGAAGGAAGGVLVNRTV